MNQKKHKVVLLGPSASGKTSIITRFHENKFNDNVEPTIGSAFVTHFISTVDGDLMLHIWDTAGQETYRSLIPMYSRGSSVIIVVFDSSQKSSFIEAIDWVEKSIEENGKNISIFFVANKIDINSSIDLSECKIFAQKNDLIYFETSAFNGKNIKELFNQVGKEIFKGLNKITQESLASLSIKPESKSCC